MNGDTHHYYNGSHFRYTLITVLSAAFNLLILLFLCFFMLPRLDRINRDLQRDLALSEHNRQILEANSTALDEHRAVIRQLNATVEAAIARARARELEEEKKKGTPP